MSALTHQERAERAADLWHYTVNRTEPLSSIIAREMFPTELVEAAKALLLQVDLKCKVQGSEGHFAQAAEQARLALDLYPEPEEPDHEPG